MEIWYKLPNGGKIEREFLIGNIQGAKQEANFTHKKFKQIYPNWDWHKHCEICWITIRPIKGEDTVDSGFYSNGTWVCETCYQLFMEQNYEKSIESLEKVSK